MELPVPRAQDRASEAQGASDGAGGAGHCLGGAEAAVRPILASVPRGQGEVPVFTTAVARELVGFLWAVACEMMGRPHTTRALG